MQSKDVWVTSIYKRQEFNNVTPAFCIYSKLIAINEIFYLHTRCWYLMNNLADTIPSHVLEKTTP